MNKKFLIGIAALVLLAATGVSVYAYSAGYCLKSGCRCHQYVGDDGRHDKCETCGHERVQHM